MSAGGQKCSTLNLFSPLRKLVPGPNSAPRDQHQLNGDILLAAQLFKIENTISIVY